MKILSIILAFSGIALFGASTHAQNINAATNLFIENKGQIKDQNGNARKDIDFVLNAKGVNVFIGKGKLSYQFAKQDKLYRVEATLINSASNASAEKLEQSSYFENYYYSAQLIGKASSCRKIVYKNIYPHIDWILKLNADNSFEYEFAVGALGDATQIKIEYKGATNLMLNEQGALIANTPLGKIQESAPITYSKTGHVIHSKYSLSKNMLSFDTDPFDGALVIDPKVQWATYYGDSINTLSITSVESIKQYNNHIYASGFTNGTNNIATTGAYQTTLKATTGSKHDLFYVKMDSSGKRLYATYFGAIKPLTDPCIQINGDTVYLAGFDISNTLATAGAQQTSFAPYYGANFLAKFDNTGLLQWCTYCGARKSNGGERLFIDKANNIYCTSATDIATADIATPGAYQTSLCGGVDGVLIKYNSYGKRIWGTFYGGKLDDGFTSITYMENDNFGTIYVLGATQSDSGIATTGAYQSALKGKTDLMLIKFDTSGNRLWGTYFGGDSVEAANDLCQDGFKNIYITGGTSSLNNIATAGAYQTTNGGSSDFFLAKFNSSGYRLWGTYWGGSKYDIGYGICNDKWGNIFICGQTQSDKFIADSIAFKNNLTGLMDGCIAGFKPNGKKFWSTYFGGEDNDAFEGITCDGKSLYLCGNTYSQTGIATPGAIWLNNLSTSEQGLIVKIGDAQIGYTADTLDTLSNISKATLDMNVKLYPNPNHGNFNFELNTHQLSLINLSINDALGRSILNKSCKPNNDGQIKEVIDIEAFSNGTYFLCFSVDEHNYVIKCIKR